MALALCGLMPHPPIVVPDVGRGDGEACAGTTRACEAFAQRLVASRPDRLFLVSPHSPRLGGSFGIWEGDRLCGSLAAFGAPQSAVDLPNDLDFRQALSEEARTEDGISLWGIGAEPLDHGAVVPLWFLTQAGWSGPTTIASLPLPSPGEALPAFGRALGHAAGEVGGRTALVASGDMSHRVLQGAPAGFHPRAIEFDEAVRAEIEEGRLEGLFRIVPELRALAAEDVIDPSTVVIGALAGGFSGTEVLSYEHPYGVGYLVAIFHAG